MPLKPYILGQVVARGGMAEVYRGLQIGQDGFRRLVAIKRILPQFNQNAEFTIMFKDEAHIGQRLQHPNIVKVECFDTIDASACIIMEFVDGPDLRSILSAFEQRKSSADAPSFLPENLCAFMIAEASRGLHYAHTRCDDVSGKPLNIIHRDISPQNILVSWEGEVKVTDFGIATADRDFKMTETRAGIVKGKYAYMSPEQISGKKCEPRTDVFALCIVFWEILAMKRLFAAENEIDVIEKVRNCQITERLSKINPNVSPELEMIVTRGLDRDPRKRYESMYHLDKTLRAFLARTGTPISASDVSGFLIGLMPERREKSAEDTRQILSMPNVEEATRTGPKAKSKPIELSVDTTPSDTSSLTIGGRIGHKSSSSQNSSHFHTQTSSGMQPNSRLNHSSVLRHRTKTKLPILQLGDLWWLAVVTTLIIGGVLIFNKHQQAARQWPVYVIRSAHQTVKIQKNGMPQFSGRFVASPVKLRLDRGLNSIEVSRDGYQPVTILVNTDDAVTKAPAPIRLSHSAIFAPVRIEYHGSDAATISVNNGFAFQAMSAQSRIFDVTDLTSGSPAELVVMDSARTRLFSCSFQPIVTNTGRPMLVVIDGAKKQCTTFPLNTTRGDHP
jgi:serine/threonine protein kinase